MKSTLKAHNHVKKLQDYMFIEGNFNFNNFLIANENKKNCDEVKTDKIKLSYLPDVKDSLFWCFYYLKNEEKHTEHYFTIEKKFKFKFVETIRNNKQLVKDNKLKLSDIENELINDNAITIKTLFILCCYYELNVIVIINNIFYNFGFDKDKKTNYIINKVKLGYEIFYTDDILQYTKNKIECNGFKNYIKSVSSYKVSELKDMAIKLNIEVNKKNKNQLYQDIIFKIYN